MAKFNELRDAEALDRLADLLDPLTNIFANEKVREAAKKTKLHAVKTALKVCSDDIMNALAIYDGIPRTEFHCSAIGAVSRIMAILNDPDMQTVFSLSGQTEEK